MVLAGDEQTVVSFESGLELGLGNHLDPFKLSTKVAIFLFLPKRTSRS